MGKKRYAWANADFDSKERDDKSKQGTKKRHPRYQGLVQDAKRDVRLQTQPYFRELERQQRMAKDQMQEDSANVANIFGNYQQNLAGMLPGLQTASQNLLASSGQNMAGLEGLFSSPEAQALAAGSAQGNLGMLGLIGQGNINSLKGSMQQGASQGTVFQQQFLADYQDIVRDLQTQRLDAKGDIGAQIAARLDELKQRKWEKRMAEKELELRQEIAEKDQRFRSKEARHDRKWENRAFDAAEDQISDEQRRGDLASAIKRLLEREGGLTEQLQEAKSQQASGGHGWEGAFGNDPTSANQEVRQIRKRRRRVRKRIKNKRKEKRDL